MQPIGSIPMRSAFYHATVQLAYFWDQAQYNTTHSCAQDGHDDQTGESAKKDRYTGVPRSHDRSDKKRLVSCISSGLSRQV